MDGRRPRLAVNHDERSTAVSRPAMYSDEVKSVSS